jgi:hypothetical protein
MKAVYKAGTRIYNCKSLFAAFLTFVTAVVYWCAFDMYYATGDDYIMSVLISSGDAHSIFMNYFLMTINVLFQRICPFVNVFVLLQIFNNLLSIIIIDYILLKKFEGKVGAFIALAFDLIFLFVGVIMIQWTHTTAFMCTSGFALLYLIFFDKNWQAKRIQFFVAFFMILIGSFYRFIVFEVSAFFFLLLCICSIIESVALNTSKGDNIFRRFVLIIRKHNKAILCIVLLFTTVFGMDCLSTVINTSKRYDEFSEYNQARAGVNDYSVAPYEGNESFYSQIGVLSQEDIDTVKQYIYDADFFTKERLESIVDYSNSIGYGKQSITDLYNRIEEKIIGLFLPSKIKIRVFALIFALVFLVVIIVLFAFRNKIKLIFPIILTALWCVFFCVFSVTIENYLGLIFAATVVVTSCFFNRFHYLISISFSVAVIGLFTYQYYSRISFRVSLSFYLPALVLFLVSISKNRLRVNLFLSLKNNMLILRSFVAVVIILGIMVSSYCIAIHNIINEGNSKRIPSHRSFNDIVQSYVKEHDDQLFVYNTQAYHILDKNRVFPMSPVDCPDNTVIIGDWQIASSYYDDLLSEKGIHSLFAKMINSDNRRFLISNENSELLETYYNNHYAHDNKRIYFKKETGEELSSSFGVYQVISE